MPNFKQLSDQDNSSISLFHKRILAEQAISANPEHFFASHPDLTKYYIGVDVGSGSARACCIDATGTILSLTEKIIGKEVLKNNHVTQSSTEIWDSICYCVKNCVREAGLQPTDVFGIAFDATCSLVAVDMKTGEPLPVGPNFKNYDQNIVMWQDHRASKEQKLINSTGHPILKYVGGGMSIEMELPKMKWLQNNLDKETFSKYDFYDLPDFLTYKATGNKTRSLCSTVCKQGCMAPGIEGSVKGWEDDFFNAIGMETFVKNDFIQVGGSAEHFLTAGEYVGNLTKEAAESLGLSVNCVVGSSVIDAYAGFLGTVGANINVEIPALKEIDAKETGLHKAVGRLASVAGTSTCHISIEKKHGVFCEGNWGPYFGVCFKDLFMFEGGQSFTGGLLNHVLTNHPAYLTLCKEAEEAGVNKFDFLNNRLEVLKDESEHASVVALAKHLFFYGDFLGNRCPLNDPDMTASIIGQTIDISLDNLAITYLASCEFLAQQTKQIVNNLKNSGNTIECIFISGSQCKNGLLMRLFSDCTQLPIVVPRYIDAAVCFGSALLGCAAYKNYKKFHSKGKDSVKPTDSVASRFKKQENTTNRSPSPYTQPSATGKTIIGNTLLGQSVQSGGDYFSHSIDDNITSPTDSTTDFSVSSTNSLSKDTGNLTIGGEPSNISQKKLAGDYLWEIMTDMTGTGKAILPNSLSHPDVQLLNCKYDIFIDQQNIQREYRKKVDNALKEIYN
ncbi:Pentulose kinase [Hanseniaspora valbyensis NRRL Y-1626]|uniref:Pentulose kinase n=1 Tax=Hanseniaspora valbyensis NRRL Y-1626 TaxID=766949 RepID=A0A1B7TIE0_9ASCO|nr:Pentulose kinase [Hanseniaspora valbyensis NRRL Y-1626]